MCVEGVFYKFLLPLTYRRIGTLCNIVIFAPNIRSCYITENCGKMGCFILWYNYTEIFWHTNILPNTIEFIKIYASLQAYNDIDITYYLHSICLYRTNFEVNVTRDAI